MLKIKTARDGVKVVQFQYGGYEISVRLDTKRPETVVFDKDDHIVYEEYDADGMAICKCMSYIDAFGE